MTNALSLEVRERHRTELIAKQQVATLHGQHQVASALQRAIEAESRAIARLRGSPQQELVHAAPEA